MSECLMCRGNLVEKTVDVTEEVLDLEFNFKNLPVLQCEKCGKNHFTEPVNEFMENAISQEITKRRVK